MAAIDRYSATIGSQSVKSLYNEPDVKKAIAAFFAELIRCITSRNRPRGCLIANVAIEVAGRDAEVRTKISYMLGKTDKIVADRLQTAQDEGQLSRQLDPQALARMVVSITQSLASRARAGATRKELSDLSKNFQTALFSGQLRSIDDNF